MALRVMTVGDLTVLRELLEKPRPPHILALQEEVAAKMRVLELRASMGTPISQEEIEEVANLKHQFDNACQLWATEELRIPKDVPQ
jgi:hypothetical protein